MTCFDENVGYQESLKYTINNDLNDLDYVYGEGRQNSALACQALCQLRSQCNFFTYIKENRACWLMSTNEYKFYYNKTSSNWLQNTYISGKKFCETPVGYKGTILPCLEQKVDFLDMILITIPSILIMEVVEVVKIPLSHVNCFVNGEMSVNFLPTYQKLKHVG